MKNSSTDIRLPTFFILDTAKCGATPPLFNKAATFISFPGSVSALPATVHLTITHGASILTIESVLFIFSSVARHKMLVNAYRKIDLIMEKPMTYRRKTSKRYLTEQ